MEPFPQYEPGISTHVQVLAGVLSGTSGRPSEPPSDDAGDDPPGGVGPLAEIDALGNPAGRVLEAGLSFGAASFEKGVDVEDIDVDVGAHRLPAAVFVLLQSDEVVGERVLVDVGAASAHCGAVEVTEDRPEVTAVGVERFEVDRPGA